MSLFGSLMGGFEEDPFFGGASGMMRQMDTMMSSMMRGDPFGAGADPFGSMMGGGHMMGLMSQPQHRQQQQHLPIMNSNLNSMNLMANPMSMMNNIMANMDHMRGESNTQMYSSSSVMTMTMGPDGKPQVKVANKTDGARNHTRFAGGRGQVYQESSTTRGGPGGVRETQRSVVDSSSGTRKLAIGHHIGERARIVERERNPEGEEEKEELLNLDETDAEAFEREFRRVASGDRGRDALEAGGRTSSSNRRSATPLAIEAPHTAARSSTERHVGFADRSTGSASDRYNLERVPIGRSSGIDASNFERRAPHERTGLDRFEYHRPNTSYIPAPTSYTRPSSYMPSISSRLYRPSVSSRPLSSYSGRYHSSGRGAGGGGRGAHQYKNHRRAGPYDQ
ncbi:Myeloid leukemia factor [Trinorchestia longiramus]|nr:Myeloid leukemia factor [Trinorchestia longiramus]